MLGDEERERYGRQLILEGWDQERLREATVLVVGLGGLGGVVAQYLAAAGVGRLRICDDDTVARSNLNRQLLYTEACLGRPKIDEAASRLSALNPSTALEPAGVHLDEQNAGDLVEGCRIVIDALDDPESRLVLARAALAARVPYVHGAVHGWLGVAGFFDPPRTACLACVARPGLIGQTPVPVAGVLPGVIGAIQATETLRALMGRTPALLGRLLTYDAERLGFEILDVERDPACPLCAGA